MAGTCSKWVYPFDEDGYRLWSSMVSYGEPTRPCTRPALSLRIASGAVDVN